jgi:hypothetical protein
MIETRVAYRYVPRVNQQDIPPFEALDERRHLLDPFETMPLIDRIRAANYVKLFLVNSLFIREHKQNTTPRVWEMARLTLSQGLDIRRTAISGEHTLGPLDVELEFNTWQRWHGASFLRLDMATGDLEAASTRIAFSLCPGWAIHLSHTYRQRPDIKYLSGGFSALWLQRFRTGFDFRFDGHTGTLREHRMIFSILA